MRTVSTKLDNQDFEKFQAMCNDDGICASEALRDMIKRDLDAHEEYLESEKHESNLEEEPKPTIALIEDKEKPKIITHGKILDDDGNIIGTF